MNQEIKAKWYEDLTSGEYKQCQQKLHSPKGYCCLGVLMDRFLKETGNSWNDSEDGRWFEYNGEVDVLTKDCMDWAGLKDRDPFVSIEERSKSLSDLNDNGFDFATIAELIKDQL